MSFFFDSESIVRGDLEIGIPPKVDFGFSHGLLSGDHIRSVISRPRKRQTVSMNEFVRIWECLHGRVRDAARYGV